MKYGCLIEMYVATYGCLIGMRDVITHYGRIMRVFIGGRFPEEHYCVIEGCSLVVKCVFLFGFGEKL